MSLIKRALPEDFSVLTGDELEASYDEPTRSDWAMSELNNAIGTLEKFGAVGYTTNLKDYITRLEAVVDVTERPF